MKTLLQNIYSLLSLVWNYKNIRVMEKEGIFSPTEKAAREWCKSTGIDPDFYYDGKYFWQRVELVMYDQKELLESNTKKKERCNK